MTLSNPTVLTPTVKRARSASGPGVLAADANADADAPH